MRRDAALLPLYAVSVEDDTAILVTPCLALRAVKPSINLYDKIISSMAVKRLQYYIGTF